MTSKVEISGKILARNTLLNFVGQAVPLLIGVITIPFIIRGLGAERFGLLSLAWVVLGYFAIFDLGIGRATIKFVAEALGKGEEEQVPLLVWTAATAQAVLGVVGALALMGITSLLVELIMNIPPELVSEAKTTFYLLALSVPVILLSSSFRGVLEAAQRFDLVNVVKIPSNAFIFLFPLVGLLLGFRLPGIVAMILLARIGALATFVVINLRVNPYLRRYSVSFTLFPRIFAYGGWLTVTSVVGPILIYLDRFLIGSLMSMVAVTYYTAPYEAVTRLWIIPASLTMTLFPAFSAMEGVKDKQKIGTLFVRSVKYVLLTLGPIILMIVIFAREALQLWLGTDFAIKSTTTLQILALGVLINSIAYIPFALLQGIGRPDLPAKFHLVELAIYVGTAWLLICKWGVAGAAGSWTLRVALDALLLFIASQKVCRFSFRLLANTGITLTGIALLLLTGMAYGLKSLSGVLPLFAQSALFIALFALFAWAIWRNLLDASDWRAILKVVKICKVSESQL